MLKKCFRADLRANFRIFLPFLIGMGGAGLLVVALQFLLPWLSSLEASAPEDVAYALGTLG